jgi:hypothetical protein
MYRNYEDITTLSLVLTLVLMMDVLDRKVGHRIPRVVDTNEQEQNRRSGDDEECRHWIDWEYDRRDEERSIGGKWEDCVPQPIL